MRSSITFSAAEAGSSLDKSRHHLLTEDISCTISVSRNLRRNWMWSTSLRTWDSWDWWPISCSQRNRELSWSSNARTWLRPLSLPVIRTTTPTIQSSFSTARKTLSNFNRPSRSRDRSTNWKWKTLMISTKTFWRGSFSESQQNRYALYPIRLLLVKQLKSLLRPNRQQVQQQTQTSYR